MNKSNTHCKLIIGTLMLVLLVLFGLLLAMHTESKTANAATSSSKVYTIAGRVETTTGSLSNIDVSDNFTVTMESANASGTGKLEQNAKLNWTKVIFKINVQNILFHHSFVLEKDGVNFYSDTLSGKASVTVYSGSLPDGDYKMCYQFGVKEGIKQYPAVNYVFTFSIDTTPPKDSLTADGNRLESGSTTNKRVEYTAEDPNFKYIYYKKPNAATFSTTTNKSYFVDAKESNSGLWSFYAADSFGQRTETVTAYLDCQPPTMTCSSGVSFGGASGKAFTVSASDAGGTAKLYVKYGSEEWFTNGSRYTVPDTERNGRYYFYAEDGFGNKTDTKWIILSTEEPVGNMERSSSNNSVTFTWDYDYWSATLDGRTYYEGTLITEEGDHTLTLDNNAGKQRTYQFTIDHYYIVNHRQEATCKESGWVKYECLQCGNIREETLYAAGHRYGVQKTPASCTEQGETIYICSVCGDTYSEPSGTPMGHSYTSHIVKEATCTEGGINESVCDVCGDTIQTKIAAKGHNYSITNVESTDGNTRRTYTCSVCGDSYTQELGDQYENVSNYVEYLFEQYAPYMYWVLLATAGLWSIAIGVTIIIAVKNEDKAKAKKMLVNYLIGLVIIFAIVVACPYLVRGIASFVT